MMSKWRNFRIGCLYPIGVIVLIVGGFASYEIVRHEIYLGRMQKLLPEILAEETDNFIVQAIDGFIEYGVGSGEYCNYETTMVAYLGSDARPYSAEIAARIRKKHIPFPGMTKSESRMKLLAYGFDGVIVIHLSAGEEHYGFDWRCRYSEDPYRDF